MPPKLRRLCEPDCCANCLHLAWGPSEGFDKCNQSGRGIEWGDKRWFVCDSHVRCSGDPRNRSKFLSDARIAASNAHAIAAEVMLALHDSDEQTVRDLLKKLASAVEKYR
jgi:hypothetical protein